MKLNIGMVLQNKFPPDIRVEKEAKALIEAGFNVFLLCGREKDEKASERINEIFVKHINLKKHGILRKLDNFYFHLTFYHPYWARKTKKFIIENNIDVLHIHDLPLLGTALKVVKERNTPIVVDLHENYPEAVEFYRYKAKFPKNIFKNIFYNKGRWRNYERKWLGKVNKIFVVIEEGKERVMRYGLPGEKIIVLPNVEDVNSFNEIKIDKEIINKYKDYFVVLYEGGFAIHRGLDCAIKAIPYLKNKIPNLKLLLVGGNNPRYEKEIRRLVKNSGVNNYVEFVGWQSFEKIPSYIEISKICLVPYNKNTQTDASCPHKLFQYMLKEKPVIVSNCKSLQRIIKETKAGLVFQAGNEKDLAKKIIQIYKNPDRYGENGYQAVLKKYNWEKESKKLVDFYDTLLKLKINGKAKKDFDN